METDTVQPAFLDYKQVKVYCGWSRTTTWRRVRAGEIDAVKLGRMVRIRRSSLDDYLDRHSYKGNEEE